MSDAYLMAYFISEDDVDGEQVRFAVSAADDPRRWTPLSGGRPVLTSSVGERGVRDPFLLWDAARERYVLLATDLRVAADGDWTRAVRSGSRSIVVWESAELVRWTPPTLREVAPPGAGNAWAPKAFRDDARGVWTVIWASSLQGVGSEHQRLLAADTVDFARFSESRVYLDPGHDVIDATFLRAGNDWFRFSANAQAPGAPAHIGHHIFVERGTALSDPAYTPVAIDVGRPELVRGEGPAVFQSADQRMSYLLIDEFALRGYQLFELETEHLASGEWRHVPDAVLPPGARHGSVIPLSAARAAALRRALP